MAKEIKKTLREAPGLSAKEQMKFKIGDLVRYGTGNAHYQIVATRENLGKYDLSGGFDYLLLKTDTERHKPAFEEDIFLVSDVNV